ncbi:MAG: Gfo/Idh/MocA family oxidoreductase [Candidatus Bathyarchaeia archaeon]
MKAAKRFNVAVIGLGGIGRLHSGVYREEALANLVAVCDIVKERADAAAKQLGVKSYYSTVDLFRDEELDLVSVCTSGAENGGEHYRPTMEAFEAGVNVLCEKPISNNILEAKAMVRKAEEKRLYFAINLNHRFNPLAARAKRLVSEGNLGELVFCMMQLSIGAYPFTYAARVEEYPYFNARALLPHSVDVMRYFCGDVRRVQAFFSKPSFRKIWSTNAVNMEFENGSVGQMMSSRDQVTHHPGWERCEVAGTRGRFVLDTVYDQLAFYPHDSREAMVLRNPVMGGMRSFDDTFRHRIHRLLEQMANGEPPEAIEGSGKEGLACQEVIEAAIKSHEEGRVVELKEIENL